MNRIAVAKEIVAVAKLLTASQQDRFQVNMTITVMRGNDGLPAIPEKVEKLIRNGMEKNRHFIAIDDFKMSKVQ